MPSEKKFELGNYVEVKDRIKILYELFAQARITTSYELTREPDDKPKVIVRALVYRTADDPVPTSGTSWMYLPGKTPYTNGTELENSETSAVGRAIGMLGILIDGSLASANEVRNASGSQDRPHPDADSSPNAGGNGSQESEEMMGRVKRRGIIRKGSAEGYKLEARQGPDGHVIGFRLEIDGDKNIPQCILEGPIGEAVWTFYEGKPEALVGKVGSVGGLLYNVKRADKPGSWYRLHVDRFENDDLIFPAPTDTVSVPMFEPDEAEKAAILAAELREAG